MMYGHGIRPRELAEYTWKEVVLTIEGIRQSKAWTREAAYLIHCSLIDQKHRVKKTEWMPMPFDEQEDTGLSERVMKKYNELKQKISNGS